jgi:hypothetical protein
LNKRLHLLLKCWKPTVHKHLTALNVYKRLQGTSSIITTPHLKIENMKAFAEIKEAFFAKAE